MQSAVTVFLSYVGLNFKTDCTSNVSICSLIADNAGTETWSADCFRVEYCCSSAASCELEGSDWASRNRLHSSWATAQLCRE